MLGNYHWKDIFVSKLPMMYADFKRKGTALVTCTPVNLSALVPASLFYIDRILNPPVYFQVSAETNPQCNTGGTQAHDLTLTWADVLTTELAQ